MTKTLYMYFTMDEDNVINGLVLQDTQFEEVPANMKLVSSMECNVPQMPSNSSTTPNTINKDNGISHLITEYSRFVYTRKWSTINHMWEEHILPNRVLTKLEFNSRFTIEELIAIKTATTPGASASINIPVSVLWDKFSMSENIDLDDPMVGYGLMVLVSEGFLTESRKDEILA